LTHLPDAKIPPYWRLAVLRAVKRQGGEQAFNRTARDLVISVCAILAYEQGTDAVAGMFDLIEHVLADD
jgi:hypothetical protein